MISTPSGLNAPVITTLRRHTLLNVTAALLLLACLPSLVWSQQYHPGQSAQPRLPSAVYPSPQYPQYPAAPAYYYHPGHRYPAQSAPAAYQTPATGHYCPYCRPGCPCPAHRGMAPHPAAPPQAVPQPQSRRRPRRTDDDGQRGGEQRDEDADERQDDGDRDQQGAAADQQDQQDQQFDTSAAADIDSDLSSDLDSLSADTGGASAPSSAAPAMIGDNFGSGSTQFTVFSPEVPVYVTYTGARAVYSNPGGSNPLPSDFVFQGASPLAGLPGNIVVGPQGGQFVIGSTALDNNNDGAYGTFTSLEEPTSALANAVQNSQPGTGTVFFRSGRAVYVGALPLDGQGQVVRSASIGQNDSFFVNTEVSAPSGTALDDVNDHFQLQFAYGYVPEEVAIVIPNPGSDAVLGRLKIAENGSPIPTNRVFANYSYFDQVPLIPGGLSVHRTTLGFEKTFGYGRYSFEMRMPYANTLDSNILTSDAAGIAQLTDTHAVEFGNLQMIVKKILYQHPGFTLAAGLPISLPTADGVTVGMLDAMTGDTMPLLDVANESVHVMPYIGWLYSTERFFHQGFVQFDIDANGNPVQINAFDEDNPNALVAAGRLSDPSFMYLDLNFGYYLYKNPQSHGLRGFAPVCEVHYNQELEEREVVRAGNLVFGGPTAGGVQVGGGEGVSETVNLVLGTVFEFPNATRLTTAYARPIGGDKQFDGEFRLIFNRYFGP